MIVQINNVLTIRNLAENKVLTIVKQGDKLILNFTDEFGEKQTVAVLDGFDIQQLMGFLGS